MNLSPEQITFILKKFENSHFAESGPKDGGFLLENIQSETDEHGYVQFSFDVFSNHPFDFGLRGRGFFTICSWSDEVKPELCFI